MKKKLLLSLGTFAAVATPIVAVVSCGSEDEDDSNQQHQSEDLRGPENPVAEVHYDAEAPTEEGVFAFDVHAFNENSDVVKTALQTYIEGLEDDQLLSVAFYNSGDSKVYKMSLQDDGTFSFEEGMNIGTEESFRTSLGAEVIDSVIYAHLQLLKVVTTGTAYELNYNSFEQDGEATKQALIQYLTTAIPTGEIYISITHVPDGKAYEILMNDDVQASFPVEKVQYTVDGLVTSGEEATQGFSNELSAMILEAMQAVTAQSLPTYLTEDANGIPVIHVNELNAADQSAPSTQQALRPLAIYMATNVPTEVFTVKFIKGTDEYVFGSDGTNVIMTGPTGVAITQEEMAADLGMSLLLVINLMNGIISHGQASS